MEKRTSAAKAKKVDIKRILKSPLLKLVVLIVLVIVVVSIISGASKNKTDDKNNLIGYQKLVDVKDGVFTYVDLDGKTKNYDGYIAMDDFYFDNTAVSRNNEETNAIESAIINKKEKEVVKYGTYNTIIQVIGGKYYKVEKDGKYGVIDYKGKEIIAPQYEYISITTVQEAKELVFECQADNKYYFYNESGKQFLETDVGLHSISYANKLNDEYDTIVFITVNDQKRYFNLKTGDELFKDMGDVNISYNIVKDDSKIAFYDKSVKLKEEIDISGDYSADARVYFRKYTVVEQKNATADSKATKYTVYDSNFKKFLESDNRINPVQDNEGNVYFIINDQGTVRIINEKKKETKVEGYEYSGNSSSNLQYLVLSPSNDLSTNEVFTFKGKSVKTGVTEYTQKGMALIIGCYNEAGELEKKVLMGDNVEIPLVDEDEIYVTDNYITIENDAANYVSLVNSEGKVILDKVQGKKAMFIENYISIDQGENTVVYDVENGKQTYSYPTANYITVDESVEVVELTNGYFKLDGKTILEK